MKLLKEKYKTYEGARKRAAFETAWAASEFTRGYAAQLYRYAVTTHDGCYRVQRIAVEAKAVQS